jgi:Resolvase, N terminal domain
MGRLMLYVLLSFAQFEREIILERTSDKMAAARRKGKWGGGLAPLGYDNHREGRKIAVDQEEAAQVRGTFELYLEYRSIIQSIKEIDRRGERLPPASASHRTSCGPLVHALMFRDNVLLLLLLHFANAEA